MRKTLQQKGSVHVVVTVCLALVLVVALGWIFWQNFIYKAPENKSTDVVVVKKRDKTPEKATTNTQAMHASFSAADLDALKTLVKSQQCTLDAQEYTRVKVLGTGQSIDEAQIVSADGTKQNIGQVSVASYQGAVDEHNTWAFMSGGCGSQAFGFLLKHDTDGAWKLVVKTGNTVFACADVDGKGLPATFMAKCWDDARNQSRAIVQ